jgi:hypothetical protein
MRCWPRSTPSRMSTPTCIRTGSTSAALVAAAAAALHLCPSVHIPVWQLAGVTVRQARSRSPAHATPPTTRVVPERPTPRSHAAAAAHARTADGPRVRRAEARRRLVSVENTQRTALRASYRERSHTRSCSCCLSSQARSPVSTPIPRPHRTIPRVVDVIRARRSVVLSRTAALRRGKFLRNLIPSRFVVFPLSGVPDSSLLRLVAERLRRLRSLLRSVGHAVPDDRLRRYDDEYRRTICRELWTGPADLTGVCHPSLLRVEHERLRPVRSLLRCVGHPVSDDRLRRYDDEHRRPGSRELWGRTADLTILPDPTLLLLAPHRHRRVYRLRRSQLRHTVPLVDLLR